MPATFVNNPGEIKVTPGVKAGSKPSPVKIEQSWTVERFTEALGAKGVWSVKMGNNATVWFDGVKKVVMAGHCTFELFVICMEQDVTTWKEALEQAKAEYRATDLSR